MPSLFRQIGVRIAFATAAGLLAGLLDLWVYEFSWRGFVAGLAAGVTYYLVVVFLAVPGMGRFPLLLFGFAILAGTAGGTAWWLVCRGAALWVAITVGAVLGLAHFASEGVFSSRR